MARLLQLREPSLPAGVSLPGYGTFDYRVLPDYKLLSGEPVRYKDPFSRWFNSVASRVFRPAMQDVPHTVRVLASWHRLGKYVQQNAYGLATGDIPDPNHVGSLVSKAGIVHGRGWVRRFAISAIGGIALTASSAFFPPSLFAIPFWMGLGASGYSVYEIHSWNNYERMAVGGLPPERVMLPRASIIAKMALARIADPNTPTAERMKTMNNLMLLVNRQIGRGENILKGLVKRA